MMAVALGAAAIIASVPSSLPRTQTSEAQPSLSPPSSAPSPSPASSTAPRPSTIPSPAPEAEPLEGLTIAIDPGHNGGNAAASSEISRPVPDGRGGTKPCNTTGTSTDDGWPEHAFTWAMAEELQTDVEEAGGTVILSREDDEGVGPCVDERGAFADDADVLVSLHANGSEDRSARGFHVIIADPPIDPEDGLASRSLAEEIVAGLEGAGRTINRSYGADGISPRPDLGGLNHAGVPAVIVELGEMRHAEESRELQDPEVRAAMAEGILTAIIAWRDED